MHIHLYIYTYIYICIYIQKHVKLQFKLTYFEKLMHLTPTAKDSSDLPKK